MNDPSRKTVRILRLMIFFSVFIMFIAGAPKPSTADKVQQAGWRVEIEPGKSKSSTLTIENRCSTPHRFRVNSKIKYLRFEESTDSLLIAASSTKKLGVQFDAMGLKSKTYRDKLTVECLDCKKEKGCTQNRDVLPVEMIVAAPNIYSYCVATRLRIGGPPQRCEVISVTPNFKQGSCNADLLTIPNDGRHVSKVGDLLHLKHCEPGLNPNERRKPNIEGVKEGP